MPASKYTLFSPAVEQYKWFHAWASCGSSSIIPVFFIALLPAVLSVSIFHIFPFFHIRRPLYLCVSVWRVRTHTLSHTHTHTNIHFPFLCFFFSLSLFFPLSISPTQSLLNHGSRCSIRYHLHSACGLARNPMNPAECISRARPHIHTTVASGHNRKPHKHSRRTLFVGPCYLAHCSLMVLVELNWGQSVGTASGWEWE